MVNSSREFIIQWNSWFPLDKRYREKYGIPFGSEEHRRVCQIDVYLDWLEDELYKEMMDTATVRKDKEEQLKKGIIVKERKLSKAQSDSLFNKIRVADFSNVQIG